jgi:hypothetical protein
MAWIAFPSLGASPRLEATGRRDRFLFHRRRRIADSETFAKILPEKWLDPAEPFVLFGVGQFMRDQAAVPPAIGAHENPVAQSQTAGGRGEELHRCRRGPQGDIVRCWHASNASRFMSRRSILSAAAKAARTP